MHQLGLVGRALHIGHPNLLHGHVALVYVVVFDVVAQQPHIPQVDGIVSAEVLYFLHYNALNGHVEWLVLCIGEDFHVLVEGAQHLGIEGEPYFTVCTGLDGLVVKGYVDTAA